MPLDQGQPREGDLELLRRLRPIDDLFMRCLFRDSLPLAQEVLRTITGIDDLVLDEEETQRDLRRLGGARSVCLDVWGHDSLGRWYDLEVQRAEAGARPRRARYHSAAMDVEALGSGDDFGELPESYVIFITERDPFGSGAGTYPVERVNMATGAPFGDGTHIVYANGSYRGDDALGDLMHDFCCADPRQMRSQALAERTAYFKETQRGASEMGSVAEELRREGREEGRAQGREEGREEGRAQGREEGRAQGREEGRAQGREEGLALSIASLMDTLKCSAQQAMDALKIPEDQRGRYLAML